MEVEPLREQAECQRALSAFKAGRTTEALEVLRGLGEREYGPAQVFLGWMLEQGHDPSSAPDHARQWYERAADGGDPIGAYYLGRLLLREGEGPSGLAWIEKASAADYSPALNTLAQMYQAGVLVPQDTNRAHDFLTRAARMGHLGAQRSLAVQQLMGGEGVAGWIRGLVWFLRSPILAVRLSSDDDLDENLLP